MAGHLLSLLVMATWSFPCAASNDITPTENLQNAEKEMAATLSQLHLQLDVTQQKKLSIAQDAWSAYRTHAEKLFEEQNHFPQKYTDGFSANLVWLRLGHLKRMLEHPHLSATETDLAAADEDLNKQYKSFRGLLDEPNTGDMLKATELAWIKYRDASADSEAYTASSPAESAQLCVKTELSWERAAFLYLCSPFSFGCLLLQEPEDPYVEVVLGRLRAGDSPQLQMAIDYFKGMGEKAISLLVRRAKSGGLIPQAAPILARLGADAVPPVVDLMFYPPKNNEVISLILAAMLPGVMPEVLKGLESDNPNVQYVAINVFLSPCDHADDAMAPLVNIITGPERKNAAGNKLGPLAAEAAIRINPDYPSLAVAVVQAYRMSDEREQMEYLHLISKLKSAAKAILPDFVKAARGKQPCRGNLYLSDLVSSDDLDILPSLIEGLNDPNTVAWTEFREALVKIGTPAVPSLEAALSSNNKVTVLRTAETLSVMKWNPPKLIPILLKFAKDNDPVVAVSAIGSLANYGEEAESAVPELLTMFRANKDGITTVAIRALHEIAPYDEVVKENYMEPPFFLEPLCEEGRYKEIEPNESGSMVVLEGDYNNDGLTDMAIVGDTTYFGTGGGCWALYLKVADRKYKKVGELGGFDHLLLHTKEKGCGYVQFHHNMGAMSSVEYLFKITFDGVEEVASITVANGSPVESGARLPIPEGCTKEEPTDRHISKKDSP